MERRTDEVEMERETMHDEHRDLEGALLDAVRRQSNREAYAGDPDARYQSSAAQAYIKGTGSRTLQGETNQEEDAAKKLERIFKTIWEEENPDAYLANIQRFMLNFARQIGISGPYERAIQGVKESRENTLLVLERFIGRVKEDNGSIAGSHEETVRELRRLKEERGAYLDCMQKAIAGGDERRGFYEHMKTESTLLEEDMDAARKSGRHELLEAQGIEAAILEHDIENCQMELSSIKLEMQTCSLKLPYYDGKIAALYKSMDNIDADYLSHSEYVILLETARDILNESMRHQPEEEFGEITKRHARSGAIVNTIFQNLPSYATRPRIIAEGKIRRPAFMSSGEPTATIHERVRTLFDDIAVLSASHQHYRGKGKVGV